MPIEAAPAAAGIMAGGQIGSAALAPRTENSFKYSQHGASQLLRDIMAGGGPGVAGAGAEAAGFSAANQALLGNYQRAMGMAGAGAGAQSAAYGMGNPYAWLQHAQAGVSNQFAGESGNLAAQQLMAHLQNIYKMGELRTNAIGLGGTY